MKVMPVKRATYEMLEDFLARNENIKKPFFVDHGYVVEIDGKIEACFVLEEIEQGKMWLKQLYITQVHAAKLPVLLETILQIAKGKQAKVVHVHSHQPVVDILLEALKFEPEENEQGLPEKPVETGNWWSYHVS